MERVRRRIMDITPYIGTIVTVVIAVGGVYVAIATRLTRLETLIETLAKTVEKHNNVESRTTTLETEVRNIYHKIAEIKELLNGQVSH